MRELHEAGIHKHLDITHTIIHTDTYTHTLIHTHIYNTLYVHIVYKRVCVCSELKLQMMMLAPNGLLNPRTSMPRPLTPSPRPPPLIMHTEIGRASCRERV